MVSSTCCHSTDYSGHDLLAIGRGERGATYRSYLMFDLSEVQQSTVVRANLRLTTSTQWSTGAEAIDVLVFPVADPWSGPSLTWLHQPGGEGGPVARTTIRPEHNGTTLIDVSELVSSWTSKAVPNRGVMLRARPEKAGVRAVWFSSEAVEVSSRPALEVEVQ